VPLPAPIDIRLTQVKPLRWPKRRPRP